MIHRKIITELNSWKNKSDRKPLILRGARQVGKTTVIHDFSSQFDVFLSLNLEIPSDRKLFETNEDIHQLIRAIHFHCKQKQSDNPTLLFIDEIQFSAKAIAMLRYFYEELPTIYVIAAGSLLETLMNTNKISFPVGRVEYRKLHPISFIEFLEGIGEHYDRDLINAINAELVHERIIKHFNTFTLIGGMPAIVANYGANKDIVGLYEIYESLLESYKDDIEKYANSDTLSKVIRHIIDTAWSYAGEQISFENFGASRFKSREMSTAFKTVEKALLLELTYPIMEVKFPLIQDFRKKPKLILLDVGLVNFAARLQEEVFLSKDIQDAWRGKIAEQVVAQELLALNFHVSERHYFWRRNKEGSQAEVDFVFPYKGMLIPIEVKSGLIGKLKSLHLYMDECSHTTAIRIWSKSFLKEEVQTPKGKKFTLLNVPFYYVCILEKVLQKYID